MTYYALAAMAEAHRAELHRDAARRGITLAARTAASRNAPRGRFLPAWHQRRLAARTLA